MLIKKNSKIFIDGHNGLVGSSIVRILKKKGFKNILIANRSELDLTNQQKVLKFLKQHKPKFIFIAAAKVGGILANNKYKAEFIYENLSIQNNLIHSAFLSNIKDLILLGSSCVYPRLCRQPIKENYLLNGSLEKTNEPYAIAKIAGIKMCESYNYQYKTNYKCLMPTNTFGPNDNYDSKNSHFFPSLINKIHQAKVKKLNKIILWGDGTPKREVIYVDDIAEACVFFMNKKIKDSVINIGTGIDYSIKEYARIISSRINPKVDLKIKFDRSKPNGTPRKVLDISLAIKYGWKPKIKLNEAIDLTYQDYIKKNNKLDNV